MKYLNITLFISLICVMPLRSQDHDHNHDHDHSDLRNEIGFSGGALYSFDHKVWGAGMHLHYFRSIGAHGKWALGGGIEQAWVHGPHFTVGAGAKYQIFDRMHIGVMPGITFFKHSDTDSSDAHEHEDSDYHSRFSVHFEAVYELIRRGRFHLGPAVDCSWSKDDAHIMLGVHVAYCF